MKLGNSSTPRRRLVALVAALLAGALPALADPPALEVQHPAPVPLGVPATLYDQTDAGAGVNFVSQDFETGSAQFDCRAADDFTVPAGEVQWDVVEVSVLGTYAGGSGPTPALNLEILADSGGLPGAASCSHPGLLAGVDFLDDGFGNLVITLPTVCSLPEGTYWLSVQADMDSTVGGQWVWAERSVQSGAPFSWENPPDGFGTGCTSWTAAGSCGAGAPDLLFSLSGVQVPVELSRFEVE